MNKPQKKIDWKKYHVAILRREARKAKIGLSRFSEMELSGLYWVASLPDWVANGAGERAGLIVKEKRPDIADLVFDPGNRAAGAFWDAYAREPEAVLALMARVRAANQKTMRSYPAWMAVRNAMHSHAGEKVDVQLYEAAKNLGHDKPTEKFLESLRKTRERLLKDLRGLS